jgi:hypothetical protein
MENCQSPVSQVYEAAPSTMSRSQETEAFMMIATSGRCPFLSRTAFNAVEGMGRDRVNDEEKTA